MLLHAEQSSAAPALLRPWEWLGMGVQDVQGCFVQGLKVMERGGVGERGGRVSPPCMELMCGERSRLRVGVGSERRYRDGGLRWAHGAARGNPSPRSPARLSAPRRCQQQSSPPGRGPGSPDSASSPPPPGESCLKSVQTNPRRAPPPPPPHLTARTHRSASPEGGGSDGAGQDPTPPCCSARKPREGFSATGGGGGGVAGGGTGVCGARPGRV